MPRQPIMAVGLISMVAGGALETTSSSFSRLAMPGVRASRKSSRVWAPATADFDKSTEEGRSSP